MEHGVQVHMDQRDETKEKATSTQDKIRVLYERSAASVTPDTNNCHELQANHATHLTVLHTGSTVVQCSTRPQERMRRCNQQAPHTKTIAYQACQKSFRKSTVLIKLPAAQDVTHSRAQPEYPTLKLCTHKNTTCEQQHIPSRVHHRRHRHQKRQMK